MAINYVFQWDDINNGGPDPRSFYVTGMSSGERWRQIMSTGTTTADSSHGCGGLGWHLGKLCWHETRSQNQVKGPESQFGLSLGVSEFEQSQFWVKHLKIWLVLVTKHACFILSNSCCQATFFFCRPLGPLVLGQHSCWGHQEYTRVLRFAQMSVFTARTIWVYVRNARSYQLPNEWTYICLIIILLHCCGSFSLVIFFPQRKAAAQQKAGKVDGWIMNSVGNVCMCWDHYCGFRVLSGHINPIDLLIGSPKSHYYNRHSRCCSQFASK